MKVRHAGFTLIELMIVIAIIAIIAAIAIPSLLQARKHGNEAAAIGALKTIQNAESIFRESDKDGDGNNDYANLRELSQTQLVDAVLGSGTKQGYNFICFPSTVTRDFLWFCGSAPLVGRTTGDRLFFTNHAGVIYYTLYPAAVTLDPVGCSIPAGFLPVGK